MSHVKLSSHIDLTTQTTSQLNKVNYMTQTSKWFSTDSIVFFIYTECGPAFHSYSASGKPLE